MTAATPVRWSIVEYRGREAFDSLEGDWRRLTAAMPQRTAFHAFEAHAAYFDHLATDPGRSRILALTDGRTTRAICPLESRVDRTLGVPLRVWGTPYGPHWPFSDPVCPEDEARRALVPALADHLRRRTGGACLLVLGPLPEESVLWDGLPSAASHCSTIAASPYVFDCERSFDELTGRLSRHFRKNLRNCGNRLRSLADVRFETTAGGTGGSPLLEAFLDVEASGWKGERGTRSAIRLHERLLAFYGDLARGFEGRDGCEVNALFAEGRCIAAEYCMRTGVTYACLKIGFDEDYARLSPGHLLHARTLERCCSDPGIKRYDQLSDADWLGVWHPDRVSLRRAYVPLGRWTGPPLVALLRVRFGSGRRAARWVRARSATLRGIATGHRRG